MQHDGRLPEVHEEADQLPGNATYAGAFAAVMANVVLIGYVVVAMREDQGDKLAAERAKKGKKAQ